VALFCVLNTASVVTAQDGLSRAETLNVEAQVQFDRGSYRQALDRWTEVYAAFRNPTTAWNIARCYEELRELDAAKVAYELFLGLEGLSPEEIEAGESRLASIRAWFEDWKGLSDRARARADEGAWTDALPMWERAARLNRTAPTLYGIAQALDGLGRAEDAVVAYRVFIAHPQADPQRVAEAMARIDALLDDARLPLRVAGWSMVGASVVGFTLGAIVLVGSQDDADFIDAHKDAPTLTEPLRVEFDAARDRLGTARLQAGVSFGAGGLLALSGAVMLYLGYAQGDEEVPSSTLRWGLGPGGVAASVAF